MIVQITMARDELVLIKEMLPIWQKYTDGFIFLLDTTTDSTKEFLLSVKEKYNILEILEITQNENELVVETNNRQMLFDAAKKYSNKIICLDADEYLDGDFNKIDLENILDSNPDTVFYLQWQQYVSKNELRIDGPWKNNYKDRIGNYIQNINFSYAQTHSTHLPIPDKQIRIPSNQLFIAHLQWLNKTHVAIKQYYWKTIDYVNKKKFNIFTFSPDAYDASVNNFKWDTENTKYDLKICSNIFDKVDLANNYKFKKIIELSKKYEIPNLGDWGIDIFNLKENKKMVFCTVTDDKHFPLLINLIGSIHKNNFNELQEIMVFDLGLNNQNKNILLDIDKVTINEIDKTNPDILKDIQTDQQRFVKGLFSWKPVVIKQALDKYDCVLYVDAGTTVLKPLDNLFKHIYQNGYLFFDCGHSIKWMSTKHVINKFELNKQENQWILDDNTFGIDAGFQGVSRKIYNDYILPMYELSKDINNFIDDGSCPNGWGTGRHDQTLFSILVQKLKYNIIKHGDHISYLNVDDKKIAFHLTHLFHQLTNDTDIFRSRWNLYNQNENLQHIKMKNQIKNLNLDIELDNYVSLWKDSYEINDLIYEEFDKKVNNFDFLKNHVDIVAKYNLGYGEKAFRYLWLLLFNKIKNNSKFLEIGVYKGSILALSQLCAKNLNKNIYSFGLSPLNETGDKYSNYEQTNYLDSIKYLYHSLNISGNNTKIIQGLSTDEIVKNGASKLGPYDMIYIDGGHDYDTVVNDITFAKNNLNSNGYLVMDDASSLLKFQPTNTRFNGHSDVGLAIRDHLDNDINYKHLLACGHNRVWIKK